MNPRSGAACSCRETSVWRGFLAYLAHFTQVREGCNSRATIALVWSSDAASRHSIMNLHGAAYDWVIPFGSQTYTNRLFFGFRIIPTLLLHPLWAPWASLGSGVR